MALRKLDLNRTILENTVYRALRDMERDSHRTARNAVDLALLFARGTFERQFLTLCRQILEDETSPYYEVINRALTRCNRQSLVTFGLNVGLEGCSRGARRIREVEEQQGFNVPWALEIYAGNAGLGRVYVQRVVSEAAGLGVHVFFLWDCRLAQGELEMLLRENPDCAFVLFTTGGRGPDLDLARLAELPNLLISVQGLEPLSLELCQALEEQRMLYGVHLPYGPDLSVLPQQVDQAAALEPLVVFLYPQNAGEPEKNQVAQAAAAARTEHQFPFALMALPGDILAIDEIISHSPCSLTFLPDGQAVTNQGPVPSNIRTEKLTEILQQHLPR